MLVFDTPLLCGDEISTGLDTASTVDILSILSYISRLLHRVTVVSLLQPSPEAVALFDEIILLGEGSNVLFTGPTEDARDYFVNLGYTQPHGMDDADYLLAVASSDRHLLFRPDVMSDVQEEADSTEKLGEKFTTSVYSEKIKADQEAEWVVDWSNNENKIGAFEKKYQNSFAKSVWLNFRRAFVLWTRDKVFIRASVIKVRLQPRCVLQSFDIWFGLANKYMHFFQHPEHCNGDNRGSSLFQYRHQFQLFWCAVSGQYIHHARCYGIGTGKD
jgi:hypothetical protein